MSPVSDSLKDVSVVMEVASCCVCVFVIIGCFN